MTANRRFCIFLLVTGLAVLASGCLGPLYGLYEGTKPDPQQNTPNPNAPPVVAIDAIARQFNAAVIPVGYTLSDPNANACSVTLYYRVGAGAWTACSGVAGAVTGLAAPAAGAAYALNWNATAQLGTATTDVLSLSIIANDAQADGLRSTTAAFIAGNDAPVVAVDPLAVIESGNIIINYTVADLAADPVNILCEYSLDNLNFSALDVAAGDLTAVSSSLGGDPHQVVWASQTNIIGLNAPQVWVRITATDGGSAPGNAAEGAFRVENNAARPVAVITPLTRSLTPDVRIDYKLVDSTDLSGSITARYSDDGVIWLPAMERTGAPSEGTTGLSMSVTGAVHVFVWDSAADIGTGLKNGYYFQIMPNDGNWDGLAGVTGPFDIGNEAPVVTVTNPVGTLSGNVLINFTISDSTADFCDVFVERSEGQATWVPAVNALGSNPMTNLPSSVVGTGQTFIWQSTAAGEYPNLARPNIYMRVTVTDAGGLQDTAQTTSFAVNNTTGNSAPVALVSAIGRQYSVVAIPVQFNLSDAEANLCSVDIRYRVNAGGWIACTGLLDATTGLAAPAGGQNHTIHWDATAQLGTATTNLVEVRVVPDDGTITGLASISNSFSAGNNAPVVAVTQPPATVAGNVIINYTVADPASDAVNIACYFSRDNSTWTAATKAAGDTTAVSTSPGAGDAHEFVWASATDIPGVNDGTVWFRVVATDGAPLSGGDDTVAFAVENNGARPVCIVTPISRSASTAVSVAYTLVDPDAGDLSAIACAWSLNGSTWNTTTDVTGATSSLAMSAIGTAHNITWNAGLDLAGGPVWGTVWFRITPNDGNWDGTAGVTGPFSVGNEAPSIAVTDPSGTQSGNVVLNFTLTDSTADYCSVAVFQSTNAAGPWTVPATPAVGANPMLSVKGSAGGAGYTFIWRSNIDYAGIGATVYIRMVATDDGALSGADTTLGISIDNTVANSKPVVVSSAIGRQYSVAAVPVTFNLSDAEDDNCSVTLNYRVNAGTWTACTNLLDPVVNLAAPAGGQDHTIHWNATADLGTTTVNLVQVRVVANDGLIDSLAGVSGAFSSGNDTPAVAITQPVATNSGNIIINYSVSDPAADAVNIACYFSRDNSIWTAATIAAGDLTGVSTSAGGDAHQVVWNSAADVVGLNDYSVWFRVTATDGAPAAGTDDTNSSFGVENNGAKPVCIITPITRSMLADVTVNYTLLDGDADATDIAPEYSIDGGVTWPAATERTGGASQGVTDLSTSVLGNTHLFIWDSQADIGTGLKTGVRFRITPDDGNWTGTIGQTGPFSIGNEGPTVVVNSPSGSQSGNVIVNFTVSDSTADFCDVRVERSEDQGTWVSAVNALGPNPMPNLPSSVGGTPHTFIWASTAAGEYPGVARPAVYLRVTATDKGNLAGSQTSLPFAVDNTVGNSAPVALAGAINRQYSVAAIPIAFNLSDAEDDTCSVTLSYRVNAGGWTACTNLLDPVVGLNAPAGGQDHTIHWNATADLGTATVNLVQVRVVANDGTIDGLAGVTNAFSAGNDAPAVTIVPVSGPVSGNVIISYNVADPASDAVNIACYFSRDNSIWTGAMIAAGDTTGVSTAPGGAFHQIVWDSAATIGIHDVNDSTVWFRVEATDAGVAAGSGDTAAPFEVQNNGAKPVCIVTPIERSPSPNVTVDYKLVDGDGDTGSIVPQYSTDGATWSIATEKTGGASQGTTGLSMSAMGNMHVFVWDSTANLGSGLHPTVYFRITPNDGNWNGTIGQTGPFSVGNEAPTIAITLPTGTQSGNVVLNFTLTDSTDDYCSVTIEGSSSPTGPWGPGTPAVGLNPMLSVKAGSGGAGHTFIWNSTAQMPGTSGTVYVRMYAVDDGDLADEDISTGFLVDNRPANSAPVVTVQNITRRFDAGSIPVTFTLIDSNNDPCDVDLYFRVSGGVWNLCNNVTGGTGNDGLTANGSGIQYTRFWNALLASDLPANTTTEVEIGIYADDLRNISAMGVCPNPFTAGNDAPAIFVTNPGGSIAGNHEIDFMVSDIGSDTVNVTCEYRLDGTTWYGMSIASGATTGLTTTPAGMAHSITWDSRADIGSEDEPTVLYRVTATDGGGVSATDPIDAAVAVSNYGSPRNYAIIDLATGRVTWQDSVNLGGGDFTKYRTTHLVLKRISAAGKSFKEAAPAPEETVNFAYDYYMSVFEVTQAQCDTITGWSPSYNNPGPANPVENLNWQWVQLGTSGTDGVMGLLAQKCGLECTLPSEAQWEYAYRAGTNTTYYWGGVVDPQYLWYAGNTGMTTQVVGTRQPNAWGLYDMAGNMMEMVLDGGMSQDLTYTKDGGMHNVDMVSHAVRGGSVWSMESDCAHNSRLSGTGDFVTGFRVVFMTRDYKVADLVTGATARRNFIRINDDRLQTIQMAFVKIPAKDRTFEQGPMGNTKVVTFGSDYYMAVYETTWGQLDAVLGGPGIGTMPVTNTSWEGVYNQFIRNACSKTNLPIGLPTESMWEYAYRQSGDDNTVPGPKGYFWGTDWSMPMINGFVWTDMSMHDVGLKQPNYNGLYDLSGNASELCQDDYDMSGTYIGGPTDGTAWFVDHPGPVNSTDIIVRGGAYDSPGGINDMEGTDREYVSSDFTGPALGFRCAMVGASGEFMVVDLTTNTVSNTTDVDIFDAKYSTTHLLLKKVNARGVSYTMGDKYDPPPAPVWKQTVNFTSDYYIGVFEVTQQQYMLVTGLANPSWTQGVAHPVENVTWVDANQMFVARLASTTGKPFSLPSEAQFEYANRGGTETFYPWGDNMDVPAGHFVDPGAGHKNACSFPPNQWGLYEMSGNVSEYCQDAWSTTNDLANTPRNGTPYIGKLSLDGIAIRSTGGLGSSLDRWGGTVNIPSSTTGFRVALTVQDREYLVVNLSTGATQTAQNIDLSDPKYKSSHMAMVLVKAGNETFSQGDTTLANATPVHDVTFAADYYMAVFEVTERQFEIVQGYSGGMYPYRPRSDSLWGWQNYYFLQINGLTGKTFTLPSESQWEYACRAGTATPFFWTNDDAWALGGTEWAYAWCSGNSSNMMEDVGSRLPNQFGLYDMIGNASDLCLDYWHATYTGAPDDGSAWGSNGQIVRGGGYNSTQTWLASANRVNDTLGAARPVMAVSNASQAYIVINLATGNWQEATGIDLSDPKYRTTHMALAKIKAAGNAFFQGYEFGGFESHEVMFARDYYIGTHELTQKQWQQVVGSYPSSWFVGDLRPVEYIPYNDFRNWFLPALVARTGLWITLPSESQWEYACRGEATTLYFWGADENMAGSYSWNNDNSFGYTHDTGLKNPNPFGLYDMTGNVMEFCLDKWHPTYMDVDPTYGLVPRNGNAWGQGGTGVNVVRRGGSIVSSNSDMASYMRWWPQWESIRDHTTGCRLAWTMPPQRQYLIIKLDTGTWIELTDVDLRDTKYQTDYMVLVKVDAAGKTFTQGDSDLGTSRPNEEDPLGNPHAVTMAQSYYIGVFEVTQAQYTRVMGGVPGQAWYGDTLPVNVSWDTVTMPAGFMATFRLRTGLGTIGLPSESQWEYACRKTTTTDYFWGNTFVPDYSWNGMTTSMPQPVATKIANDQGVYNIVGNVEELVEDDWHAIGSYGYESIPTTMPVDGRAWIDTPTRAMERVMRGGNYTDMSNGLRSSYRRNILPTSAQAYIGFRVVMTGPLP